MVASLSEISAMIFGIRAMFFSEARLIGFLWSNLLKNAMTFINIKLSVKYTTYGWWVDYQITRLVDQKVD